MAKVSSRKIVRSARANMIESWFIEEAKEANKTVSAFKVHLLVAKRAQRTKVSIADVYAMLPVSVKGKSGISFADKLAEFDSQVTAVKSMPNVLATVLAQRNVAILTHARICKGCDVEVCKNAKIAAATRKAKKASEVTSSVA